MTNHSYYDDIAVVRSTLHRGSAYKERSETIYEQYKNLLKAYEYFSEVASTLLPTDHVFTERYNNMTAAYCAFEFHAAAYDDECKKVVGNRLRVDKLYYTLTDSRSTLIKSRYFLGMEYISPESIATIRRLHSEASTIGFSLDIDERDTILSLEDMFNKM